MDNKINFLLFVTILSIYKLNAQDYKQQFNELFSQKDTVGQLQVLEKWEKADSNDPELFVSYFNYYFVMCKREAVAISQNPKGDHVLQIKDQDTSNKEPVAFMFGDTYYEPTLLTKGFDWINRGIINYPNRLDMRFGKTYIYGQLEDYEKFTSEIIKTIEYSNENKNNWTWTDNKSLEDPKEFLLSSIQNYQHQLYSTEDDKLLNNMKQIAEKILKYYPDHVESLSSLSVVYMLQKQYDKALEPLLKAEKINPSDYIVLGNLAQAYKLLGNKKSAIKYYELTVKYGDEQAKKYAQGQIDELK